MDNTITNLALLGVPQEIDAIELSNGESVTVCLRIVTPPIGNLGVRVRFFLAGEVHGRGQVGVSLAELNGCGGSVPIDYGYMFQPFEMLIPFPSLPDHNWIASLADSGRVMVTFTFQSSDDQFASTTPVRIATGDWLEGVFAPVVFSDASEGTITQLAEGLCSPASLQPFGWIEGCVIDGIVDLMSMDRNAPVPKSVAANALDFHLRYFFRFDGTVRYNGPTGEVRINDLHGIEAFLPFAGLLRIGQRHPAVGLFRDLINQSHGSDGLIIDRGWDPERMHREPERVSIEGCYTVAYPLALLGAATKEPHLMRWAREQISHRTAALLHDGIIFQRTFMDQSPLQGNWARALCWYLLGTIKTMTVIEPWEDCTMLMDDFVRVCNRVICCQRSDGLFSTYLDEPESGVDCSGSAGIAAAFALAADSGFLDHRFTQSARRVVAGLQPYILHGGLLGGVAQLNRGGDDYQRTGPKVIGQFAMGLTAQLIAALEK